MIRSGGHLANMNLNFIPDPYPILVNSLDTVTSPPLHILLFYLQVFVVGHCGFTARLLDIAQPATMINKIMADHKVNQNTQLAICFVFYRYEDNHHKM